MNDRDLRTRESDPRVQGADVRRVPGRDLPEENLTQYVPGQIEAAREACHVVCRRHRADRLGDVEEPRRRRPFARLQRRVRSREVHGLLGDLGNPGAAPGAIVVHLDLRGLASVSEAHIRIVIRPLRDQRTWEGRSCAQDRDFLYGWRVKQTGQHHDRNQDQHHGDDHDDDPDTAPRTLLQALLFLRCDCHSFHRLLLLRRLFVPWVGRRRPGSMTVTHEVLPVKRWRGNIYIVYEANPFCSIALGKPRSEGNGRKEASADRRLDVCGLPPEALGRRCRPQGRGHGLHRDGAGGVRVDPTAACGETATTPTHLRGKRRGTSGSSAPQVDWRIHRRLQLRRDSVPPGDGPLRATRREGLQPHGHRAGGHRGDPEFGRDPGSLGYRAERIARTYPTFAEGRLEPKLIKEMDAARESATAILDKAFTALLTADIDAANEAVDDLARHQKLIDGLSHHVATRKGEELLALAAIVDSLARSANYATDIAEIAIDRAVFQGT